MAKQVKKDRQAVIDSIRKQQSRSDKRRGLAIVAVCTVIALLIVGAAAFKPIKDWYDLRQYSSAPLGEIGAPAEECQEVTTEKADGQEDHVPAGTPVEYDDAPPAFGQHWDRWAEMDRKLYSEADRPELGELVHNLEHGYTVLWYDETVAEDEEMMDDLRGIASKLQGTEDFRDKFKAAPWTSKDGKAFPEGQHVALTHWSAGGDAAAGDATKQVGVWQYCSAPSGEALEKFMTDYPYLDSPEPNGG